jgi:hypothetical protein
MYCLLLPCIGTEGLTITQDKLCVLAVTRYCCKRLLRALTQVIPPPPPSPTCGDMRPDQPGNQSYPCPSGSSIKPGSSMTTPPSDSACCVVSAGIWVATALCEVRNLACTWGSATMTFRLILMLWITQSILVLLVTLCCFKHLLHALMHSGHHATHVR